MEEGQGHPTVLPVRAAGKVPWLSFGLRWTDGIRASLQGKRWKYEVMPVFASSGLIDGSGGEESSGKGWGDAKQL